MASVWQLIKDGHYAEACALADSEYSQKQDVMCLRNKVLALLCLEQLDESAETSQVIINATQGSTDSDFIFLGVAHWLTGKHSDAVSSWKRGLPCAYTDAAGGVEIPLLLIYGATRLGDQALASEALEILSDRIDNSNAPWPAPLAAYILRRVTNENVIAAMSQNVVLKAKQQCQAFFCFGVRALENHDIEDAGRCFHKAVGLGAATLTRHEYYLARHEVSKLQSASSLRP